MFDVGTAFVMMRRECGTAKRLLQEGKKMTEQVERREKSAREGRSQSK